MLYTTDQAFEILKEQGITSSKQQITKWIRQGKLKAIPFEKNKPQIGYRISHEELRKFIDNKKITREDLMKQVQELEAEVSMLKQQLDALTQPKKKGRPRKIAGNNTNKG